MTAIVVAVVIVALAFAYTNGFHDAANAMATAVSTRALTPRVAMALAAVLNFVGAMLGQQVARTVSQTIGDIRAAHGLVIVLAALLGAVAWNVVTWWRGLPSSSSHALISGLVGAALAGGGTVHWGVVVHKVLLPMVISPLLGFGAAFALMLALLWALRHARPTRTNRNFRALQTVSASVLAAGHGLQDAAKTMGVIFLALVVSGRARAGDDPPLWVVLAVAASISLGTWSGGWRIMRTLGRRIIYIDPARGFVAETVGALILFVTALSLQAPVSSTQTIASAIVGAGTTHSRRAVRWRVARSIGTAWLLTPPAAAAAAAGVYVVLRVVLRLP